MEREGADALVREIRAGKVKFSITDARVVTLMRWLGERGLSGSEIGAQLGVSRDATISFCHRVRPGIKLTGNTGRPAATRGPVSAVINEEKRYAERQRQAAMLRRKRELQRKPRNSGDTLSTHYVRLQRAMEERKDPPSVSHRAGAGLIWGNVSSILHRDAQLKKFGPRCCWAACTAAPLTGKPYCMEHLCASGASTAVVPHEGARSK